jgi:DNA-binding CsgD family transcriptional regulator
MNVVTHQLLEPLGGRPPILHTHCRLAYGSVLSNAGRWGEAEAEILEAIGPTASRSLGHRTEAIARLAELRVHQGRIEEAMELLAPYEDSLAACGPLVLVHLQRGEPDLAVATASRGLRQLVGDVMRRGPLLSLLVRAEIACGDLDAAGAAANELATMVEGRESRALRARRDLAAAEVAVARADIAAAVASFESALAQLAGDIHPLLSGVAHLELAEVLASSDDRTTAAAIGEARAALSLFDRLGARSYADRTSAFLRQLGAPAKARPHTDPGALDVLTNREAEVLALLREGKTNREIAERLYITPKTAEHHVGRILTKLGVRTRAEAAAVASAAALPK